MTGYSPENVAAVVVTFNPGDRLRKLMSKLCSQVGAVLLVDNASEPDALARIEAAIAATSDEVETTLILNPRNRGLAAAQNQGIAAAVDAGFDWVLLMDHDSVPEADMVETLLAVARDDPKPESLGFLAPMQVDESTKTAAAVYTRGLFGMLGRRTLKPEEVERDAAFVMASGCLVSAARLREIGPMAEDFFIDYIDYDFAFRVRGAGYRIVIVGSASLSHRLGEVRETNFLGRKWKYREHKTKRRYTIYRNRTRVRLGAGVAFREFKCFELLSIAKDLLQLRFLEPKENRAATCRAIRAGIRAGKRGRGGIRN